MPKSAIIDKTSTVGTYLLDRLYASGVHHIFGVPGDYVLRMDKLIEQHEIQFVNTTRENTAGYMADAYARMRGLGAACITYGVGINITNAMAQAYVESSPIVIISGAAGQRDIQRSQHLHHLINTQIKERRDITQMEIFRHVTVDRALLDDPETALDQIDRVLHSCWTYKKPVYLEIPRDMTDKEVRLRPMHAYNEFRSDPEALREAINETIKILRDCERPILWIGHEIQRFGLVEEVLQFAEKYRIPITTSLLGKGAISEHHPLFVGVYQGSISNPEVKEFVDSCDAIFILGVLLSDVNTGIFSAKFEHHYKLTACADNISIGHHQFPDVCFLDFVRMLADTPVNIRFRGNYPALIDKDIAPFKPSGSKKITSKRLFECIQDHLKSDHILVTDIGDSLFGSEDIAVEQNAFIACAYFATLGFSIPASIAIQLVNPKKRVIAIVGDGAFQMTSTELSTAVRYHIDPIVIVLNNHGYGTERPLLEGDFNDIVNWKYSELPKLLGGGKGVRVTTEGEFEKALSAAIENRGEFQLIEVELGKTDFSPAMQRFGKLVKP